jgi:hypothetical protein
MSHVAPWGAKVWAKVDDGGKLDARGRMGQFVGYDDESRAIKINWSRTRRSIQ